MIETGSLSGMTGHKRFPTRTRSRSGHYTQLKNYFSFEEHGAFDTFDHLGRYIPEGNKAVTGYVGEIPATQRFVMLKDQDRVFKDSYYGDNYFFGKSHKQSATSAVGDRLEIKGRNISSGYGTMQTEMLRYFYNSPNGGESTNGQSARSGSYGVKTISPKFYFNHRRFGYLSDMIRQGRDSAMYSDRFTGRIRSSCRQPTAVASASFPSCHSFNNPRRIYSDHYLSSCCCKNRNSIGHR